MLFPSTAVRLSIVFTATFSVSAILLPYFPLFLHSRGLDAAEIGTILGVTSLLRLALGPFGALADRFADRRPVYLGLAVTAFLSFLTYFFVNGFAAILAVTVVTMLFWNPVGTIVEAVAAMHAARGAGDFGRMRSWGSAAFVVVSIGAGWYLRGRPGEAVLTLQAAALGYAVLVGVFLPPIERKPATQVRLRVRYRDLLKVPGLIVTFAAAALVHGSHSMLNSFGSIHWASLGFRDDMIGVLWSAGVLAETIIFTYSARLSRLLTAPQWLLLGAAAAVLRWSLFPFVHAPMAWMALQTMHALTFGATHIGAVQFMVKSVGERQSVSAQSLYWTMSAVTGTVATFLAGPLYAAQGVASFAWMALLPAAAFAIALLAGAGRVGPTPRP
jgi:PPP family 3-phenylpropionic acid transporter